MKVEFNSVTWYSRLLSFILLLGVVPVLVFFIGREYQKTVSVYNNANTNALADFKSLPTSQRENTQMASVSKNKIPNSGIKGTITVGPTCPVSRVGTEEECSDKPLAIEIKFINQYGEATSTKSDKYGSYKIILIPGTYTIMNAANEILPALNPVTITINQDEFESVNLSFDSGLR